MRPHQFGPNGYNQVYEQFPRNQVTGNRTWMSNKRTSNSTSVLKEAEENKHETWHNERAEFYQSLLPQDGATRCVTTTEVEKRGGQQIALTPRKKGELAAEMNYLYQKADGMPSCQSMQVTIKRTLQEKIFKSVKFLPKNNTKFKYPDWVEGVERKEATVLIVNGVLKKMNLENYSVKQKTRFWITYSELFRQFFTEHRSATQESLKRVFFDNALGKLCYYSCVNSIILIC